MVEQSLAEKNYTVDVNITTCHITYSVLRNFNPKDLDINGLHIEQGRMSQHYSKKPMFMFIKRAYLCMNLVKCLICSL